MELSGLKAILVSGRDIILNLSNFISKGIPFTGDKIAIVLVLLISFWIASSIISIFPNLKSNFLIKLLATGGLFYVLWIW